MDFSPSATVLTSMENPEPRQKIGDRLSADTWHIDAILPPDASDLMFESLQPVASTIQGTSILVYTTPIIR